MAGPVYLLAESRIMENSMTAPVLIGIGASAGGIETLVQIVVDLPQDLPAAIGVVVHIPINVTSLPPHILGRSGLLPATHAQEGEVLQLDENSGGER